MQTYTDDCYAGAHVAATDMQNIENNFAALKSAFSGATTPANTVAGMWWFDTTANILKLRNEANNAWQSVWDFANSRPGTWATIVAALVSANFGAALKDPAVGTAGLRTIGAGATAAMAGNTGLNSVAHTGDVTGTTALTIGAAKITQAKLKTSQGSVTLGNISGTVTAQRTLPGGEYGFDIQGKWSGIHLTSGYVNKNMTSLTTSYVTSLLLSITSNTSPGHCTIHAQQRYVTSSGEIHWIFVLRDKITKDIISMYQAPDHPCFGNGGKPLLVPHPFGSYDPETQEIIVINPTNEEIETMELETIVDDETKPDKDLLEVITENYEIDESSSPAWPTKPVTVGLPKHIKDKKTGKKTLADYRFMGKDDVVEPVKKVIPKPDYIKVKRLRKK